MVFLAHESALTAITSNRIGRLAPASARMERLETDPIVLNPQPWRPRARLALEFNHVPSKNGFQVTSKVVPEDIVKQHKVSCTHQ